jgi:hypothetical protein
MTTYMLMNHTTSKRFICLFSTLDKAKAAARKREAMLAATAASMGEPTDIYEYDDSGWQYDEAEKAHNYLGDVYTIFEMVVDECDECADHA